MSFGEAISSVFSHYADFSGRARRSEFWFFYLFTSIIEGVLYILALMSNVFAVLLLISTLALFIPSLSVAVRRLHDTGRSGAWILIALIPFGRIIRLVFYCSDSEAGCNQYGPSPKYISYVDTVAEEEQEY
ncbi:DUF805 domain-containing protein [Butyrivibrio proteoclasticus]|uniref:DUF805 domain-containing protein n=1 Tax=Butyrivibrio proteoclasticus TaxID=43305 RepID=UPI000688BB69|nr:DUF805 domain-containing protein [Butyrivibrio proteoclasticus]